MNKKEMLHLKLEGRTYQYIANRAGVSRQRIQQILSPPKLVRDIVVSKYNGYCSKCGLFVGKSGHVHHNSDNDEDYDDIENLELLCLSCHRRAHGNNKVKICLNCGSEYYSHYGRSKYCSRKCWSDYCKVELICGVCGRNFKLSKSEFGGRSRRRKILNLYFCSKRCHGSYWGRNFGRGSCHMHPRQTTMFRALINKIRRLKF